MDFHISPPTLDLSVTLRDFEQLAVRVKNLQITLQCQSIMRLDGKLDARNLSLFFDRDTHAEHTRTVEQLRTYHTLLLQTMEKVKEMYNNG